MPRLLAITTDMKSYLAFSTYIDGDHPEVAKKAAELAAGCAAEEDVVKKCFEFVRDAISHSWDYQINKVTCRASDVLQHKTGFCYAKSHLLAALLRKNGIPTGLCYQRVPMGAQSQLALHGLNAVHLKNHGWYRIDPRGNKPGVNAQFAPPHEFLAFQMNERTMDLPEIWPEPLPQVVHALTTFSSTLQVLQNLPDIDDLS